MMCCQKATYKGSEKDKKESGGNVHFSEVTQDGRLLQSDESREGLLEEINFSHEDVRGLGSFWDLLHKGAVDLC